MSLTNNHYQSKGLSIMGYIQELQAKDPTLVHTKHIDRLIGNLLILYFISNKITFELLQEKQPTYIQISDVAHAVTNKLVKEKLLEGLTYTRSVSTRETTTHFSIKDGWMRNIFIADNHTIINGERKLRFEIHTLTYNFLSPDICLLAGAMVYFLEELGIKTENLGTKDL